MSVPFAVMLGISYVGWFWLLFCRLRECPREFMSLPNQAMRCVLDCIQPIKYITNPDDLSTTQQWAFRYQRLTLTSVVRSFFLIVFTIPWISTWQTMWYLAWESAHCCGFLPERCCTCVLSPSYFPVLWCRAKPYSEPCHPTMWLILAFLFLFPGRLPQPKDHCAESRTWQHVPCILLLWRPEKWTTYLLEWSLGPWPVGCIHPRWFSLLFETMPPVTWTYLVLMPLVPISGDTPNGVYGGARPKSAAKPQNSRKKPRQITRVKHSSGSDECDSEHSFSSSASSSRTGSVPSPLPTRESESAGRGKLRSFVTEDKARPAVGRAKLLQDLIKDTSPGRSRESSPLSQFVSSQLNSSASSEPETSSRDKPKKLLARLPKAAGRSSGSISDREIRALVKEGLQDPEFLASLQMTPSPDRSLQRSLTPRREDLK